MSEEIKIYFGEDGIAREYDDTYDITIHCESKKEQDELIDRLSSSEKPNEQIPVMLYPQVEGITPTVVEPSYNSINALSSSEKPNKSEIPTGWIPVSERLPEKAGRYLCVVGAKYRNPREMYYAPQKWANKSDKATWRSIDGAYVYDWFVKEWMPLPELPEPYKASSIGWIPVSVIEDIKAEINELSELDHIEPTYEDCKRDVLEILDKYKVSPTGAERSE